MIKVWKNYDRIPQEIKRSDADVKHIFCGTFKSKKLQSDEKSIGNLETVRGALRNLYHATCGYCEGKFPPYEVEHYRAQRAYETKHSAACEQHAGYAWLCQEWSNLLYSCGACNNAKSNKVPIQPLGVRVLEAPTQRAEWRADSAPMQVEYPDLLNPELDVPEAHLYCRSNGEMGFSTARGEQTIKLCHLNRADLVLEGRKKIIDTFQRDVREALLNFDEGYGHGLPALSPQAFKQKLKDCFHPLIKRLIYHQLPWEPFSLLHWSMLHDMETFCISKFPKEVQQLFQKIMHLWRESQLTLEAEARVLMLQTNIPTILADFTHRHEQEAQRLSKERFSQDLKYSFIQIFYNFIFLLKGNRAQLFCYIDALDYPIQRKLLKKAWKLCESDARWSFNPALQAE